MLEDLCKLLQRPFSANFSFFGRGARWPGAAEGSLLLTVVQPKLVAELLKHWSQTTCLGDPDKHSPNSERGVGEVQVQGPR